MKKSNWYQYQEDIINGLTKGRLFVIGAGRGTGKSLMTAQHIQTIFGSSYTDWEETFVWPWDRKVSIYGAKIWGKIQTRRCRLSINGDGSPRIQYATEREVFKKILKDGANW